MENKSFTEWVDENWEKDNIFPPALNPQQALDFLKDYLLGKDWYTADPISTEQVNTEIVYAILLKYSKDYRKEAKKAK